MEVNRRDCDKVAFDKFNSSSTVDKSESKSKLKKKMKKEKRKKSKKKKDKKKRHRDSSSDESSSDSDENEWVEKETEQSPDKKTLQTTSEKPLEREEWMNLPGIFPTISEERRKEKSSRSKRSEEERFILNKPGQHERELNPHWKNGGTGLPDKPDVSKPRSEIFDVNWLKKSLQRAKETAEEKGISLEEVAAERWGSLDAILEKIKQAEGSSKEYFTKREKPREWERHKRPSFKRPRGEDDFPSSSSVRRDSNAPKNWQKREVREKKIEERYQSAADERRPSREIKVSTTENLTAQKTCEDVEILTEEEMNKLGAKIVKAEIMGNDELAAELKLKLQTARDLRKLESSEKKEEVILTQTDAKGITRPLEPRAESSDAENVRRRKKMVQTHVGGERVRYFADDDKYSLNEMFHREKGKSSKEEDEMFVKLASKNGDMDELFEQNITFKASDAKQDARDRSQAIKEHQKKSKSMDNCQWCIDSQRMLKHMIIAVGSKVYLSLPAFSSLTTGHCFISPLEHVLCQTQLDENVYEEVKLFKKTLIKMFAAHDKVPVFFEVAMNFHRYPHMQLICIPLSVSEADLAPMYFKKALLECETEWSNNKKVVDLKQKDIQRAIPKGLSYFEVDFGNHAGFAHVIEDERLFPKNFAQEIIGGMLDVDHNLWRKPKQENFEEQTKKVMEFHKMWKSYDFTEGRKLL